jgi:ABC-type thiamin/hydroxymethylpyrimidine transport system permease subunit
MLLTLVVWVGGLIFFPVVAQTAFSVLPTPHLAGLVVRRSLIVLHWMGIVSGVVFLASSLLYNRLSRGALHPFAARHVLICIMLLLSLISQFYIIPRMDTLRASAGEINSLPAENPIRAQFDALHSWSTRLEGTVLLLGLLVTFLAARSFQNN